LKVSADVQAMEPVSWVKAFMVKTHVWKRKLYE